MNLENLLCRKHELYFHGNRSNHRLWAMLEPKTHHFLCRNRQIQPHALNQFQKRFSKVDCFHESQNY